MKLTGLAHKLVAEVLPQGGTAIDATAGNGQDTAYLAKAVGEKGRVLAIDIQPLAIATTRARIESEGVAERCELKVADHADLDTLAAPLRGKVDCILFNLGYLPGSDHSLTTKPITTGKALRAALGLVRPGGRIVCVAYTGHPGGEVESETVEAFGTSCEEAGHDVRRIGREPGTGRPWILSVTLRP